MASSTDRAKEAEKHLAEAKKCLKTSLLKWSPDYDNAANHFEKAAMCFRNLRNHKKAIEAFEDAAEAYWNNNALFHSAKALEQAANVARDARMFEESGQYFQSSSERYHESGHPDTATMILEKAAKMLQHENPVWAADYFLQAADIHLVQDKYRGAALCVKDALRMYCRYRQSMEKVIEIARKAREYYLRADMIDCAFEAVAVELVALLHSGSAMDAREVFQEAERKVVSFAKSEWDGLLDRLLEAWEQQDTEEISICCNSGHFKALDPEFAKFARDLEGGKPLVKRAAAGKMPPSRDSSKTAPAGSSGSAVKVGVGKKDPKALADMRNQLFSKSSTRDSKEKEAKSQQKSRVDASPEPLEDEEPTVEAKNPEADELSNQPEQSQGPPETPPLSEENIASQHDDDEEEDNEDEPLDIN